MSNFFNAIGVADMEKVHSAVIGWMLSDKCQAFDIKAKSTLLCNLFQENVRIFNTIDVHVEVYNIDILIETNDNQGNKECWVIENKIKSNQHSNQLDKYVDVINGTALSTGKNPQPITTKYVNYPAHYCFLTLIQESPRGVHFRKWKNLQYKDFLNLLGNVLNSKNNHVDAHILTEYAQCLSEMTSALNDFLKKPEDYPFVFTDGSKKKTQKNMVAIGKSKGGYASYIAECGLETIFQKCLLSQLFNNLPIVKNIKDWGDNLVIEEWHGTAMFGTGLNNWQKIQNSLKMQIEFQGGSFKVVLISNDIKNYKGNNRGDYNKIFNSFNGQWVCCFVNNKGKWTPNTKSNKPRISLTKTIPKNWYSDKSTFEDGFGDAIRKAKVIIKDWCNKTGNTIP